MRVTLTHRLSGQTPKTGLPLHSQIFPRTSSPSTLSPVQSVPDCALWPPGEGMSSGHTVPLGSGRSSLGESWLCAWCGPKGRISLFLSTGLPAADRSKGITSSYGEPVPPLSHKCSRPFRVQESLQSQWKNHSFSKHDSCLRTLVLNLLRDSGKWPGCSEMFQ